MCNWRPVDLPFDAVYIPTLLASRLCSIDDKINECGAVGGMRTGRVTRIKPTASLNELQKSIYIYIKAKPADFLTLCACC
jgi:hypothetical protein